MKNLELLIQIELQQILRDAGVRDATDIQSLRRENQDLREELERPGHPQRSQTTVGGEAAQVILQFIALVSTGTLIKEIF